MRIEILPPSQSCALTFFPLPNYEKNIEVLKTVDTLGHDGGIMIIKDNM